MSQFILCTQHKEVQILFFPEETILDVLNRIGVSPSMVNLSCEEGGAIRPVSLLTFFTSLSPDAVIRGRIIRNIKLDHFLGAMTLKASNQFTTEWIEVRERNDSSIVHTVQQLSSSEALAIVNKFAQEFFDFPGQQFGKEKIIVGASGGGDSNALLSALSECVERDKVIVVTLKGFPDWTDGATHRATLLCEQYRFRHIIVAPAEVARLCGFSVPLEHAIASFRKEFGADELIFLSTFAIQQSLIAKAKEIGARDIVLGANREDILGEALYYLTQQLLPAPFPARPFGDAVFGFPLWKVPKKIIDGVHPKMSQENYRERDPGSTPWRNRFYYLAHLLEDKALGVDGLLLEGLAKLSHENSEWLKTATYASLLIGKRAKEISERNWMQWLEKVCGS